MQANSRFHPLGGVSMVEPPSMRGEINANVRAALARATLVRPYLRLDEALGALRLGVSGDALPIAIVGGAPSINGLVDELRDFDGDVLVCGTAHDWSRRNGIAATYYLIGDHHPIICRHLLLPDQTAIYFVACQCDHAVFNILADRSLVLWHCVWPGQEADFAPDQWAILEAMRVDGGSTAGMRALSLVTMLGYRNVHLYGFDSCLDSADREYAYEQEPNPTATEDDPITEIRLGRDAPGTKVYRCKGWQVAQARDFQELLRTCELDLTFHGGGLISDMWNEVKVDRASQYPVEVSI
jgi:hypothetical protein